MLQQTAVELAVFLFWLFLRIEKALLFDVQCGIIKKAGCNMAAKTANVLVRVEPEVKAGAEAIVAKLGVPASTVINMPYKPIIMTQSIPFSKRQYAVITGREQKDNDVIAYHLRQSFKPGEITPELANKIGYDLAMSLTKGKRTFIVCIHVDKHYIHLHIVFNSTPAGNGVERTLRRRADAGGGLKTRRKCALGSGQPQTSTRQVYTGALLAATYAIIVTNLGLQLKNWWKVSFVYAIIKTTMFFCCYPFAAFYEKDIPANMQNLM